MLSEQVRYWHGWISQSCEHNAETLTVLLLFTQPSLVFMYSRPELNLTEGGRRRILT